jgi:hypothetical protein
MANHGDPRRAAFRIKQPAPEKVASTLFWKAKLPIVISPQNILALAKGQVRQAVMGTLKMGVAAMSDGTPATACWIMPLGNTGACSMKPGSKVSHGIRKQPWTGCSSNLSPPCIRLIALSKF